MIREECEEAKLVAFYVFFCPLLSVTNGAQPPATPLFPCMSVCVCLISLFSFKDWLLLKCFWDSFSWLFNQFESFECLLIPNQENLF